MRSHFLGNVLLTDYIHTPKCLNYKYINQFSQSEHTCITTILVKKDYLHHSKSPFMPLHIKYTLTQRTTLLEPTFVDWLCFLMKCVYLKSYSRHFFWIPSLNIVCEIHLYFCTYVYFRLFHCLKVFYCII